MANPLHHHVGPNSNPKQFVLCFDGTGNKFAGDESDSNVLKIFRVCLDRFQGFGVRSLTGL
jgi:uncharacterized protein (DUF2235 family)